MLVISRKTGEFIYIGSGIKVVVLAVDGRNRVRLGVQVDETVPVLRGPDHVDENGIMKDGNPIPEKRVPGVRV